MNLEIGKYYHIADGRIVKIILYLKTTGNFYGRNLNGHVAGYWQADGNFNTGQRDRKIIEEVSRETNPEYYL